MGDLQRAVDRQVSWCTCFCPAVQHPKASNSVCWVASDRRLSFCKGTFISTLNSICTRTVRDNDVLPQLLGKAQQRAALSLVEDRRARTLPLLHLAQTSNRQRSPICQTVWTGCCTDPLVGGTAACCHFHRGATAHAATPSCLPPRNSWEWSIPPGGRRSRFADVMGLQASMHEQIVHRSRSRRDGKISFSRQSLVGAEQVALS